MPQNPKNASESRVMETVHVFISKGRFNSSDEMRAYLDPTYTEEGELVPSTFIKEVRLDQYEPGCIEAIFSESGQSIPLLDLLTGASYFEQWLPKVDGTKQADAAICVFAPNAVEKPYQSSLEYLGAFSYLSG